MGNAINSEKVKTLKPFSECETLEYQAFDRCKLKEKIEYSFGFGSGNAMSFYKPKGNILRGLNLPRSVPESPVNGGCGCCEWTGCADGHDVGTETRPSDGASELLANVCLSLQYGRNKKPCVKSPGSSDSNEGSEMRFVCAFCSLMPTLKQAHWQSTVCNKLHCCKWPLSYR